MGISKTLAIGLVAVACAGSALAQGRSGELGGSCVDTVRRSLKNGDFKLRTVVVNETSNKSFHVVVYRNSTEKNSKTISADEKITTNMNAQAPNDPSILVKSDITGKDYANDKTISCSYTITATTKSGEGGRHEMTWTLPEGGACGDIQALCGDCRISCNKSYSEGNGRWTTTFTISD